MSTVTLFVLLLIPCTILAKCPGNEKPTVCKSDPCKGVSSPYCEPEKCGKCRPVCYSKKGGSRLPCYFKKCQNGAQVLCHVNGCNLIMGQRCVASCSHCDPICLNSKGKQEACNYMSF